MDGRGEVCLAEEAERLWRSGMGADDVSRRMGVDAAWVEAVISPHAENEEPGSENGSDR